MRHQHSSILCAICMYQVEVLYITYGSDIFEIIQLASSIEKSFCKIFLYKVSVGTGPGVPMILFTHAGFQYTRTLYKWSFLFIAVTATKCFWTCSTYRPSWFQDRTFLHWRLAWRELCRCLKELWPKWAWTIRMILMKLKMALRAVAVSRCSALVSKVTPCCWEN